MAKTEKTLLKAKILEHPKNESATAQYAAFLN
jgi:hypothetical protein